MEIAHASWIAMVIVMATSFSDGRKSSLQEVVDGLKVKWTSLLRIKFQRPRDPKHIVWLIVAVVAVVEVLYKPYPFSIVGASIDAFVCFVSQLYTSVVWTGVAVISIVEDGCEAVQMERAEKLAQGRRLDGFMANLLFSILCLILVLGFWIAVGDQGSHNLTVYGHFFVNAISITRIFVGVMYTVYYFRCREYHGGDTIPSHSPHKSSSLTL